MLVKCHLWAIVNSHTVYNILSRSFTATNSFSCVTMGFSYSGSVSSVTEIIINVRRKQALNPPVSAAILAYAFFSMIATWGLKDKSRSNVTPRILRVGSISMDLTPIKRLYGYWDFPSVIASVLEPFLAGNSQWTRELIYVLIQCRFKCAGALMGYILRCVISIQT